MGMIFYMSAQPATESMELSGGIGEWLARLFSPDYQSRPEAEWTAYVELVDHLIRKAAHFTEYAIFGIILCLDLFLSSNSKLTWKKILLCAWLTGSAYSVTDEFHQLFVEGRSGELFDVLIDSSGVFVGGLLAVLVGSFIERRKIPSHKNSKP